MKVLKAALSAFLILGLAGYLLAAEAVHKHAPTPEMRRQHNSMSVTMKQWAALKKSLAKGDFAAAEFALARMQKAASALEKFKLHKNAKKIEEFREQSRIYRENLTELGKALKEQVKAQAQGHAVMIDKSCSQCHDVFR